MQSRQSVLRRTWTAVVALTSLATVSFMAPSAAAAAPTSDSPTNALSASVSTHKSVSAKASWSSWSSAPVSTVVTATAEPDAPIRIQVVCTVSVGPPFRMGNGNVGVDWSVICDGQVRMIQGIVGILNSSGVPLGNTVDQFTIFGLGGGNLIQRPCAAGVLQGAMRVRVTFLSGTPLVIEGVFFGPAGSVC